MVGFKQDKNFAQSNNENVLIDELKCGYLTYNKPHGKEEIVKIVNDFESIVSLLDSGWRLHPGVSNWILKAPETPICDLSDVLSNPTRNPLEIFTLYQVLKQINIKNLLKKVLKNNNLKKLEIFPICGDCLHAEIRIAGSDNRVFKIPSLIINFLKKESLWKMELAKTKRILTPRPFLIRSQEFNSVSSLVKNYFKKIQQNYYRIEKLQIETPKELVTGIWSKIIPADLYIFIPKAGFRYALGFTEERQQLDNLIFWEYHTGIDRSKELIIFNRNLRNKKVAIVDRYYSGKTLFDLKNKLIGEKINIKTIALFPKSQKNLNQIDYMLFLDKFIKIKGSTLGENWVEDLFIKIVNNQI